MRDFGFVAGLISKPFEERLDLPQHPIDRALGQFGAGACILLRRKTALEAAGALGVDRVSGASLTVALRYSDEVVTAPNVVAVIEGSDPALRGEYVVVSGHMDHVGIGLPDENGDSIYNGADDNASGTTAVIEIAEAVASLPTAPRRSMMFLLVSGEEKGLWGSEYFAGNSPVPVDRIVADLNHYSNNLASWHDNDSIRLAARRNTVGRR